MHAVIFDIDGTLLQSASVDDALYRESVTSVLGHVRFRPSLGEYDFVTDSGILAQILNDNGLTSDPDHGPMIKARFVDALASHVRKHGPFREIMGARAMLGRLCASSSHAVAIATGGWLETALLKLYSAEFDLSGIPLATANDFSDRTDIMSLALSRIGSEFQSITYYGDGPWDRSACQSLGWNFVAVGAVLGGIDSFVDVGEI